MGPVLTSADCITFGDIIFWIFEGMWRLRILLQLKFAKTDQRVLCVLGFVKYEETRDEFPRNLEYCREDHSLDAFDSKGYRWNRTLTNCSHHRWNFIVDLLEKRGYSYS